MTTLWEALDTVLLEQLDDHLGPGGDHATWPAEVVEIADDIEPDRWKKPALLVTSSEAVEAPGPFSDGTVHLQAEYPYAITAVIQGESYRNARALAQEYRGRILTLLRTTLRTDLMNAAGDDGETPQEFFYQQSAVDIVGPVGGEYLGVAQVAFSLRSEI